MDSAFVRFTTGLLVLVCQAAIAQDTAPASRPEAPAESRPAEAQPAPRAETAPVPAGAIEAVCERRSAPYKISGQVSVSYRARTTDDGNDEDAYGYVSIDGGDPDVDEAIFHLMGRVTYDFDPGGEDDPFNSLNDIDGDSFDWHVYEAFVDLRGSLAPDALGLNRVRLGRQDVFAGFTYLVDGVHLQFDRVESWGDLRIGVFGGIPEYLYEESRSGDWIAGLEATWTPWCDGRFDFRYTHVEDENDWVDNEVDDFASISLRQRVRDDLTVFGVWNTIDAGTRDASFRFDWVDPCRDLAVHGTYRYQATITNEFTTVYDPYVGVLGTSYAYHQIQLEASKLFSEHFGIDAGISGRLLQDRDDEGPFNRDFVRGWTTLTAYKWPHPEFDVSVTGELWHSPDDQTASAGADVTWNPEKRLRVHAGTYYSLYKHDLFVVDEREDVTTIFLKLRWKFRDDLRFDGRYEFEIGDEGTFHTAVLGLTWTF